MAWWHPAEFGKKRPYLEARAELLKEIRGFFETRNFVEVETPILQVCPVMDMHIHAFRTEVKGVDLRREGDLYLHTSPEFAMKKLLVAGMPRLFQICHVFRNGEGSRLHSREFTMIEWYRAPGDYHAIMDDCEGLLRACARRLGVTHFRHASRLCDPFAPWQKLSVAEAFKTMAGIDLAAYLADRDGFAAVIAAAGIRVAADDRWDDLFFRVMAERIEPFLGDGAPTILYDYPVCMASLSRRKGEDPRFAERFELYVCGIELANAFSELTDPAEQEQRFHEEMAEKQKLYGESYPIDPEFIAALRHGLPECGGIALGIDRLAMLATGVDSIEQVLWAYKI